MIEKKLDIKAEDGTAEAILYAPDSGKHPGDAMDPYGVPSFFDDTVLHGRRDQ